MIATATAPPKDWAAIEQQLCELLGRNRTASNATLAICVGVSTGNNKLRQIADRVRGSLGIDRSAVNSGKAREQQSRRFLESVGRESVYAEVKRMLVDDPTLRARDVALSLGLDAASEVVKEIVTAARAELGIKRPHGGGRSRDERTVVPLGSVALSRGYQHIREQELVLFFDGTKYHIADGDILLHAAHALRLKEVRAVVYTGTLADAKAYRADRLEMNERDT